MTDFVNLDDSYFGNGLVDQNTNDVNAYQNMAANNFSSMAAFAQQGHLFGGNDDLNSFFSPGLNGPNKGNFSFDPSSMRQGQWENGDVMQMFNQPQGFPFPMQQQNAQMQQQQQMSSETNPMMDATWLASTQMPTEEMNNTFPEEHPMTPEEIEKPKRGRPRKRKRKDPISEEEKQRKREAFLERNRRAASKCRKRKKESTEQIQARASNLDRESRLLTAELIQIRAEHANWLIIAIEHAKSCPNNNDLQSYLKAAESRLEALASFVPMNRSQAWDDYQAILKGAGNIDSGSMSPRDTSDMTVPEMEYFDNDQYQRSIFDEDDPMQTVNEEDEAPQPLDNSIPADAKAPESSITVTSTNMDRRGSTSSIDTTAEHSSKDSAYFSTSRTPEDIKLESLDEADFTDTDKPQQPIMLPNLRLADAKLPKMTIPSGSAKLAVVRPSTRRLRSSNNVNGISSTDLE